jgi:uncharacterized glyoxalase superfamily protein PhnB
MTTSSDVQTPSTRTGPAPAVWSALRYHDAATALAFLTDVLGFRPALVVPDDPADPAGDIAHAELRWPDGGGVMLGSSKHRDPAHAAMGTGATSVYLVTDRVDELHARCVAAGADIVTPLEDTDYGSHTFGLRDHEGNLWTLGTYRGAPWPVSGS